MLLFLAICKRQFRVSRHLQSTSNESTKKFNFLQFTFIPDFSIPAGNHFLILPNFKHFKTFKGLQLMLYELNVKLRQKAVNL